MKRIVMATPKLAETESCVVTGCQGRQERGAPTPICLYHLRLSYAWVLLNDERGELTGTIPGSPRHNERPGVVYFARRGDRVKIGYSSDLARRLRNIGDIDEVLHTEPGTMRDEKHLHSALSHLRIEGEWFALNDEMRGFIDNLRSRAEKRAG